MANKTLTARVKFDTKSAESSLKRLQKLINNIDKVANKRSGKSALEKQTERAILQQERLKQATLKTKIAEEKLTAQKHRTALAAQKVKQATDKTNNSANKLLATVKKIAGAYLGIQTLKLGIETSDKITSAENRLNNLEGGSPELTAESMDKIYAAAQRARTSYTGMLSDVSKTMTLAGDSFQGNIDNAIRFQEIMAKSYVVGGASAQEARTSMYQLVQALGSGTLAGDELRSVREGAPLAYKAIEKYAQGLFAAAEAQRGLEVGALGSTDSLKKLASDGKISSEIVVAAVMDMENGVNNINDKFNNTQITFAQAWENIKNMATRAFQPALQALNKALNDPRVQQGISLLGQGLLIVGNILSGVFTAVSWLFNIFGSFFGWCANNWSWLSKVILTVLTIIGVIMAVVLFPKFIAWISYLAFVIAYYVYLGAQAVIAGIKAAIAWMAANWVLLLIIVAIVAVLAAVIWLSDGFADACGMIVGFIMGAISVVWNLFVTLVTFIVKSAILPLVTAWDNFANFFGNLFNDPIGAIVKGFAKMGDTVLSILQTIAQGIDAVFGSNLADTVQGWRNGLSTKADELANKWGTGTYEEKSNLSGKLEEMLTEVQTKVSWNTSDAYNTGYEWGHSGGEWITEKLGALGSMLTGSGMPDMNDPANDITGAWDEPSVDELLSTVDSINDNMDLTDDDLEYLRKIAEMEWRKEFTTAEIKIDMTNNNTVNGERDLDGIVSYLGDVLRQEMSSVAEGVHY